MPGLIAASASYGWTYGGSILTFVFPELLFITVAATLYVLYSKPHLVPGHRYRIERAPVTGTGAVRAPGQGAQASGGQPEAGQSGGSTAENR